VCRRLHVKKALLAPVTVVSDSLRRRLRTLSERVDWAHGLLSRSACARVRETVGRTRAGGVKKDSGNNGGGMIFTVCTTVPRGWRTMRDIGDFGRLGGLMTMMVFGDVESWETAWFRSND
jgi:hypothetical protein